MKPVGKVASKQYEENYGFTVKVEGKEADSGD
jgi:hypothetical protein